MINVKCHSEGKIPRKRGEKEKKRTGKKKRRELHGEDPLQSCLVASFGEVKHATIERGVNSHS